MFFWALLSEIAPNDNSPPDHLRSTEVGHLHNQVANVFSFRIDSGHSTSEPPAANTVDYPDRCYRMPMP
jgi:hypothetical protein